jgi:hypothetical protein
MTLDGDHGWASHEVVVEPATVKTRRNAVPTRAVKPSDREVVAAVCAVVAQGRPLSVAHLAYRLSLPGPAARAALRRVAPLLDRDTACAAGFGPTPTPPGSPGKLEILAVRAQLKVPLFHPGDAAFPLSAARAVEADLDEKGSGDPRRGEARAGTYEFRGEGKHVFRHPRPLRRERTSPAGCTCS